ncbi:MAG: hypothetical protein DMF99_00030 [Acidobacteria bacterium]|nr:MAG: hypothetical protein DMF99_00030 [Acidobacteriota bacterium]
MKVRVLIGIFLLAAAPGFAQTNVTGDWDVTINSPQGANTIHVTFKQDGEKLSGVLKGQAGELPFQNGSVVADDLKFSFTVPIQGTPLDITMTGKVKETTIEGKAEFGGFGEGDWTAKRSAETSAATTTRAPDTTAPATTTSNATSSVAGIGGKWDVTIKTPGGDLPATATLTDEGGKLSGTFGSPMGEVPLSGSLDGKVITLTMVAQTPQGAMNVAMTGDLDGDTIVNGKADVAGMGQMEWSAKRIKQ